MAFATAPLKSVRSAHAELPVAVVLPSGVSRCTLNKRAPAPLRSRVPLLIAMNVDGDSERSRDSSPAQPPTERIPYVVTSATPPKEASSGIDVEEEDEEQRLQNDRPFVLREFGKLVLAAAGIGLILFFFDILVSLVALSFGALYALAVLFDVRFATNFVRRVRGTASASLSTFAKRARSAWSSIRRRIFGAQDDD